MEQTANWTCNYAIPVAEWLTIRIKQILGLRLQDFEYHITFFQSGFNAIVKMWLAGGCKETPEEMNEIIRSEYQGRLSV